MLRLPSEAPAGSKCLRAPYPPMAAGVACSRFRLTDSVFQTEERTLNPVVGDDRQQKARPHIQGKCLDTDRVAKSETENSCCHRYQE